MIKKLLISICVAVTPFRAWSQEFVITEFGASTESTKLNTEVIQQTIDQAQAKGGGTIVVPKGIFLTGALFFKPDTKLRLEEGAVLKGSDNIDDYPLMPSRMEGRNIDYYAALINAYHVDNFSISGPGTIDGNGLKFWKAFWAHRESLKKLNEESTNLEVHRPRLLFIWGCNHVRIQKVNLRDSGYWTTHLYQCEDVLMEKCDIRSPFKPVPAPSTDGVDIDVCKKVTIRNCFISVNDDAVCIKGGKGPDAQKLPGNGIVEDVLVENCTFGAAHATLTLGSESIHARNITMRNCKVDNDCPILRLKMRADTFQIYENVTVDNITGKCGSVIELSSWKQFVDLGGSTEKPYGIVRKITMSNIKVQSQKFGDLAGNPSDKVSEIVLKNIEVKAHAPRLKSIYPNVKLENVVVNGTSLVTQ